MIVTPKLGKHGRLGNQMFQYATLYSVGKKLNYEIGVPDNNISSDEKQHFCLREGFEISASDGSLHVPTSWYHEPFTSFDNNIFNIADGYSITGYFASEKYFKEYRKDIIEKEFKFKDHIHNKANEFLNFKNEELVSVHVRRGDFVLLQDYFPLLSEDYYVKAFEFIPKHAKVLLFSDDYSKAEVILKSLGIDIAMKGTNDKFLDMCLMTKCNYHIIANSTFSWWGAWLSNSKKVISPKLWVGPAFGLNYYWGDIYCEGWEVV